MKKAYQAPVMEVVELEFESQFMSASADLPGTGTGGDEPPADGDANRHRGEWGNLWATGE